MSSSKYYIRVTRSWQAFSSAQYFIRKRRRFLWDATIYHAYSKEEALEIKKAYEEGEYE